MRMLNGELQNFQGFLMSMELSGRESRMRTRFCKVVNERLNEMEEERMALVKKHAVKDDKGEPVTRTDESGRGVFDIPEVEQEKFNQEYNAMIVEEFVLDETEERKAMLTTIRDIVLNTNLAFKGDTALVYDRWCDIVEAMTY